MDPVTLSLAKNDAESRRTWGSPQQNVGTRVFGGRMGTLSAGTPTTFQVTCEVAQHFDAVRLVLANTSYQSSDNTVNQKVSVMSDVTDLNNAAGTWVQVTKSAASRIATAIAPAASGRMSYTVTDWTPISSVARTDSGTQPLIVARVYMSGNSLLPVYGDGTDSFTNWATRTDGRLWSARSQALDGVGTIANFTSTTQISQCPIVGIQYLARGKVITVGGVGDSITEGRGTYLNEGFDSPACAALSNMADVAVEYSNFGWSGQLMSTFTERALDILTSEVRPDVMVFPAGSPNDQPVTLTAAGISSLKGYRTRIIAACAERGVVPVMFTWLPVNTAVNAWGATDSLRVADNVSARARTKILLADTEPVYSGVTTGGQVQIST